MAPEVDPAEESIVLARFESRHAAEHMLVSIGQGFRKEYRKGHVTALVASGNQDGSLKLTQSRVLTASSFVSTALRISLSCMIGFMGLLATVRGGMGAAHEVRKHKSHVGSDEQTTHAILARVSPSTALVLVRCDGDEMRQTVVARAADRAAESWDGSLAEFLADLDPGTADDWVRSALGEPSKSD
jgi:uncharacterized membrane protein